MFSGHVFAAKEHPLAEQWTSRRPSRERLPHRPAGFILKEAMRAVALAMALAAGTAQMLAALAQQQRLASQYTAAVAEAGNRMEESMSQPWDDTTAQQLAAFGLSQECRRCLPDGKLQVEVFHEDENTRRITIRIDWRRLSGNRSEPVRLVGWKFRHEETGL